MLTDEQWCYMQIRVVEGSVATFLSYLGAKSSTNPATFNQNGHTAHSPESGMGWYNSSEFHKCHRGVKGTHSQSYSLGQNVHHTHKTIFPQVF